MRTVSVKKNCYDNCIALFPAFVLGGRKGPKSVTSSASNSVSSSSSSPVCQAHSHTCFHLSLALQPFELSTPASCYIINLELYVSVPFLLSLSGHLLKFVFLFQCVCPCASLCTNFLVCCILFVCSCRFASHLTCVLIYLSTVSLFTLKATSLH